MTRRVYGFPTGGVGGYAETVDGGGGENVAVGGGSGGGSDSAVTASIDDKQHTDTISAQATVRDVPISSASCLRKRGSDGGILPQPAVGGQDQWTLPAFGHSAAGKQQNTCWARHCMTR